MSVYVLWVCDANEGGLCLCCGWQTCSGDFVDERDLCGKLWLEGAEAVLEREAHVPRLDSPLAPLRDIELLVRCAAPQVEEHCPASCWGDPLAGEERGGDVWRARGLRSTSSLGLGAAAVRALCPDTERCTCS